MPDEPTAERPDDDDQDLLTFGEAGARLTEELTRENRRLAELTAAGADDRQVATVRQRIQDLEAAAERQRRAATERSDFQRFFGYDPKKRT